MFYEESVAIRETFKDLSLPKKSKILDLGSSVREFRTMVQPYIEKNVFEPLKKRGFKIFHADIKKGKGINLVLDAEKGLNPRNKFDLLICTSLLEHIKNVKAAAKNIAKLVKNGGYAWISVPYEYPYHADPIDTMFRPTNKELEKLFPHQRILKSEILNCEKGKMSIIFIKIGKDKI